MAADIYDYDDAWALLRGESAFVCEKLNVNHSFLIVLYEGHVIEATDFDDLLRLRPAERNHRVVVELLPKRPDSEFSVFADALRASNQTHILNHLLGKRASHDRSRSGRFARSSTSESTATGHQNRLDYLGHDLDSGIERTMRMFSKKELRYNDKGDDGRDFIGSGSFGEVFKGRLSSRVEDVAVKVVNSGEWKAFKTEVAIFQKIQGSLYIIQLLGICMDADFQALILHYAPHGDLDNFLSRCGDPTATDREATLCKDWIFRWKAILQIALGMRFLHSRDIVHRDFKSRNVYLDEGYNCKIGDFNLSRVAYDPLPDDSDLSEKMSRTGSLWFRAPESFTQTAASGSIIDKKKYDCYGFGRTVYHIKELKLPDCGEERDPMVIESMIKRGWQPAVTSDEACPPVLLHLIGHCLSVSPCDRPDSSEIVQALVSVNSGESAIDIDSGVRDMSIETHRDTSAIMGSGARDTFSSQSAIDSGATVQCHRDVQHAEVTGYTAKLFFNWKVLQQKMKVQKIASWFRELDSSALTLADAVLSHVYEHGAQAFTIFESALQACQRELYEELQGHVPDGFKDVLPSSNKLLGY